MYCLLRVFALLVSGAFFCGGATVTDKEAEPAIKISASDAIPDTPAKALNSLPSLTLIQPPSGKRLPYEVGKDTTLTIQFEIFSNPLLLKAIGAHVCIEFDKIESETDDEGNTSSSFEPLHAGISNCFPGRAVEVVATGFVPGDYRLRTTLKVPGIDIDESNLTDAVDFKVLPRVPFEPSYDWARVEDWQSIPAGLDVKMPIGGNDFRKARIPNEWKIQAFVLDEMGKKKGTGKIHRVIVTRTDRLAEVRAKIAEAALSRAPCLTLSIGGSSSKWATLESNENQTVEGGKLFETGVEIAGVLDRETGICACDVPEKGRACHLVLTSLETCEIDAGSNIGVCSERAAAVADCFTRCSLIGDPYASEPTSHVSKESEAASEFQQRIESDQLRKSQAESSSQGTSKTGLSPAIGNPPSPLQKGWSDLQWGGDEVAWPARSQWTRCKFCSYIVGTWGGLGIHSSTSTLPSGLPTQLASTRYANRFRTQRATHPAPRAVLQEEYDEASSRCDFGKRVIISPAFIVAVYDVLNVHHLIAELLLPLFRTIVSTYGAFRDDALVFLEVGHPEQAPRLQRLLQDAVVGDTGLGMLSRLTRRPIGSAASLEQGIQIVVPGDKAAALSKPLCFRDLHIGLDLRNTSSALEFHTQFLDATSPEGREAVQWQHQLRKHLIPVVEDAETIPVTSPSPPLPVGVLFVKRLQTRKFKNLVELKGIARDIAKDATTRTLATTTTTTIALSKDENSSRPLQAENDTSIAAVTFPPDWKGWTNEVVMERLTFSKQVEQLERTTVLVAVLGQGAANVVFMTPGSSLVLVVPPKLDSEKKIFANIAVASGVHVFLIESENKTSYEDVSAEAKAKLLHEGKYEKEIFVDPVRFKPTLHLAAAYASACDLQTCETLPVARVHFWPEVEEHWKSVQKQVAAEQEQAKAEKKAKEVEKKANEQEKARKDLEEQLKIAKAQVARLENKMATIVAADIKTAHVTADQEPQHEEL